MPYPIIDPDDSTQASELAQALIANKDQPDNWVFTTITDWSSSEARGIRYEMSGLEPDLMVRFRGAVHNGQRGTAMHLFPKEAQAVADEAAGGNPTPL